MGIVNFGICLQCWEVVGLYMTTAIFNGGPATLVYGSIISTVGSVAVVASLAEIASIDPHVGAQYRWSAHCSGMRFRVCFKVSSLSFGISGSLSLLCVKLLLLPE